jgi:glucans biosynthesis protein C
MWGEVLNSDEIRAPALDGLMSGSQKRDGPRGDDLVKPMVAIERQFDADANAPPRCGDRIETISGACASRALNNMRGLLIVLLLAFHSVLAYLGSLEASAFPFDDSPYKWRAFPVVDSQRWFGFDIFCAWQDVYLMSLMFFLSGLFAWPSLARKGSGKFFVDRLMRLGVPFVFGMVVVTPIALYPAYRLTAIDPGPIAYVRHFLALPFWPNGPMWFLWLLMAFTMVVACLHRLAPQWVGFLSRLSSAAAARPGRYFIGLAATAALAYVPLALAFTPWNWSEHGLFGFQLSRPLLYAVYYFAGLGVGAYGLERGLLALDGMLARRWSRWFAAALASFLLWMGLTAMAMNYPALFFPQLGADASFALAGASGCFFMMAACLRFGAVHSRIFGSLSNNAFGMYLLHYIFVVWLQYALLGLALLAIAKAMIVIGGALAFAWAATAALRFVPFGSRLIGEEPGLLASAPSPRRVAL